MEDDKRRVVETVGVLAARANELSVVEQLVDRLEEPSARSAYWIQVADAFAESEQAEKVEPMLAHALESSEAIELVYDRVIVLGEVAARSTGRASELFTEAIALIPEIESNYRQSRALLALAQGFSKTGGTPNDAIQESLRKIIVNLE